MIDLSVLKEGDRLKRIGRSEDWTLGKSYTVIAVPDGALRLLDDDGDIRAIFEDLWSLEDKYPNGERL